MTQERRHAETQHQLDPHGEHRIGHRDRHRVPEIRILEEFDVVAEPDETPCLWEGEVVALQRIEDGGDEGHQNAGADQQGGQGEQVGQQTGAALAHDALAC